MTLLYKRDASGITLVKDGRKTFDTGLLPVAAITEAHFTASATVSFDSPDLDLYYFWSGVNTGGSPPQCRETVGGVATMPPDEWGPTADDPRGIYTHDLPDVLLGTVPVDCDGLDVQVILTRTKNPNQQIAPIPSGIIADSLPPVPPVGEAIRLLNGSLLLEECYPLTRGIAIKLVDNADPTLKSVILRRYQSIAKDVDTDWSPTNSGSDSGLATWITRKGALVCLINYISNSSHNTPFLFQKGSSAYNSIKATALGLDYESIYDMTFDIMPQRLNADPTIAAPTTPAAIRMTEFASVASASSFSYTSELGVPDSTRHIIAMVVVSDNTPSGITASSVTIGGVAAARMNHQQANPTGAATDVSIWIAAVPTGASGTVAVTTSATTHGNGIEVMTFACYNFTSWTAQHTAQGGAGTTNIATVNPGFVFIAANHFDTSAANNINATLSGPFQAGQNYLATSSILDFQPEMGFGTTTGATVGIVVTSPGTPGAAAFCMCAVSMG